MSKNKTYKTIDEETAGSAAHEEAVALSAATETAIPDGLPYALIENGTLQITPDIEEEIAAADKGEVITLSEFQNTFAQWLDK